MFVGDIHLMDKQPKNRLDDYSLAIRTKLIECFEIAEEKKNKKPNFNTGIFQAASSLQAVGGGDVLSAIQRINPLEEIRDATVRTAVATETIAAGSGGGGNNTPPPADTNGAVSK